MKPGSTGAGGGGDEVGAPIRAVVLARGQHRAGGGRAQEDCARPGLGVGDGVEQGGVRDVDALRGGRDHLPQHGGRGLGRCGSLRRARDRGQTGHEGHVRRPDGVHRVEDGGVHHGERPLLARHLPAGFGQELQGGDVPVAHHVRPRGRGGPNRTPQAQREGETEPRRRVDARAPPTRRRR